MNKSREKFQINIRKVEIQKKLNDKRIKLLNLNK